jgi:hypothetical protein
MYANGCRHAPTHGHTDTDTQTHLNKHGTHLHEHTHACTHTHTHVRARGEVHSAHPLWIVPRSAPWLDFVAGYVRCADVPRGLPGEHVRLLCTIFCHLPQAYYHVKYKYNVIVSI